MILTFGFKIQRLGRTLRSTPTVLLGYISLETTAENQLIAESSQIYNVKCYAGNKSSDDTDHADVALILTFLE